MFVQCQCRACRNIFISLPFLEVILKCSKQALMIKNMCQSHLKEKIMEDFGKVLVTPLPGIFYICPGGFRHPPPRKMYIYQKNFYKHPACSLLYSIVYLCNEGLCLQNCKNVQQNWFDVIKIVCSRYQSQTRRLQGEVNFYITHLSSNVLISFVRL